MTIHPVYVGCDVSKTTLDIFDPACGKAQRIANNENAAARLAGDLAGRDVIVVMEATGPYDRTLRSALDAAKARYARVNPARARRFAQAAGLLAKTDAVDAKMLAALGSALTLEPDRPEEECRKALAALTARRDQLVQIRADEKKRRHEAAGEAARSIDAHLAFLNAEVRRFNEEIDLLIQSAAALREDAERLTSAPGVGPVAAAVLLAQLPELGRLSPKEIAALAGLAPVNNDSGAFRGVRRIRGGRRRVRQALYMAALAAIRSCERFRDFHQRILDRSKAKKVAIIAVARKLLVILNAMLREKTEYA